MSCWYQSATFKIKIIKTIQIQNKNEKNQTQLHTINEMTQLKSAMQQKLFVNYIFQLFCLLFE